MQTQNQHKLQMATVTKPHQLAAFDLDDPAERRINASIQQFYGPDGTDRLCAIRRGSVVDDAGVEKRIVWTMPMSTPARRTGEPTTKPLMLSNDA